MRAQLKHVLLDVNLPSHNKVKVLKLKHGVQGKCALYEVYCAMSKATNAIIEPDLFLLIAEENEVEKPQEFLDYCIDKGLITAEGLGLTNTAVIADQEAYYRTIQKREADKKRKFRGNSVEVPGESAGKCDTDIDTDTDLDTDNKKNNCQQLESKPVPDSALEPFMADASAQFEKPNGQDWTRSAAFVGVGRQPMKKYPEIWISPHELAEVFRILSKQVPKDEWRRVFQKVKFWATTQITDGKKPERINTAHALQGWALKEVLEELNSAAKLKRNTEVRA